MNAYGILGNITLPLMFKIFKPKKTLNQTDEYKTKPQLAAEIITELKKKGFFFELVLADSLYGSSPTFKAALNQHQLLYILAIKRNHRQGLLAGEQVKFGKWQEFYRIFTDGEVEKRYIQEIIFTQPQSISFWKITIEPEQEPKNQIWYIMTNLQGDVSSKLGNLYGFRNWVEYAFKQAKNQLGWADFRVTDYRHIEKWWELVMSAYLMVSLQAQTREEANTNERFPDVEVEPPVYREHKWWDGKGGWKSTLNNLQLIVQPYIFFNLLKPWLEIFEMNLLSCGFRKLLELMNEFRGYMPVNSG